MKIGRRTLISLNITGAGLSIYANSNLSVPDQMRVDTWTGELKKYYFLTHIGLLMTIVTLLLGVLVFFARRYTRAKWRRSPGLKRAVEILEEGKSTLLALILPIETLITLMYWVLYFINPALVVNTYFYSKNIRVSPFTDMCMHLFPFLFLLVEFFCSKINRSWRHIFMLSTFTTVYVAIMHLHFVDRKGWPYGVIRHVEGGKRYMLFFASFLVLCLIYLIETEMHKRLVAMLGRIAEHEGSTAREETPHTGLGKRGEKRRKPREAGHRSSETEMGR